jgi:hypothetical protein
MLHLLAINFKLWNSLSLHQIVHYQLGTLFSSTTEISFFGSLEQKVWVVHVIDLCLLVAWLRGAMGGGGRGSRHCPLGKIFTRENNYPFFTDKHCMTRKSYLTPIIFWNLWCLHNAVSCVYFHYLSKSIGICRTVSVTTFVWRTCLKFKWNV